MSQSIREVKTVINGQRTMDGDGVVLTRFIGGQELNQLDPFLLMDAFGSDKPLDYIGGFPTHPHRGFETVTYMLAGKMRHKDSAGNAGVISEGDIQWMTAGKGIVHSEMPEQQDGLLSGIQLWVNLAKSDKMINPKYQEFPKQQIPIEKINKNYEIKVIAGITEEGTRGIIENKKINPVCWDVKINRDSEFENSIPVEHNGFIYVIEGEIEIGLLQKKIKKSQLAVLEKGRKIVVKSNSQARFLLVAGKPLNEPIARGGPFVMNTQEEIHKAFADYKSGNF